MAGEERGYCLLAWHAPGGKLGAARGAMIGKIIVATVIAVIERGTEQSH